MASKDELYVSVDLREYKRNKANILASQVDIINSIKRLRNIRQIKEQEKNLKIRLYELFSSIQEDLEKLEDSIPTPTLPKSVREKVSKAPVEFVREESAYTSIAHDQAEPSAIDLELAEIQEKLKALNG